MNTTMTKNRRLSPHKISRALIAVALLSLWLVPMFALAEETPAGQPTVPTKGLAGASAQNETFASLAGIRTAAKSPAYIVGNIIYSLLGLLGVIFVVLIIYAGFLWMTAQGNEEQISKAKKLIVNAVVGIIIITCAWPITGFVLDKLATAAVPSGNTPATPQ